MRAVWARARADLRSTWRRNLGLVLLVAAASGAVMATAAGARRTVTAYDRFVEEYRGADVLVVNYPEIGTAVFDFVEVAELPEVAQAAEAAFEYVDFGAGTAAVAPIDDRLGAAVNRLKVLDGRPPDPSRADEALVAFDLAERFDLEVGDEFPLFDREQAVEYAGTAPPEERAEVETFLERAAELLPRGTVRIVGIEASPGEFPPQFAANGALVRLTPAAAELLQVGEESAALVVRLHRGEADVPRFVERLEERAGGVPSQVFNLHDQHRATNRSIRFQSTALWVLAAMIALTAALVLSQTLARGAFLESADNPVLQALGMTRRQVVAVGLTRWVALGIGGAALGAAIAVASSPLFPTGLARTAEPDPGLRMDMPVVAVGAPATVLAVLALAAVPTWRAARLVTRSVVTERDERRSPSVVADAAARAGFPPSVVAGLRLALERGRGRSAMPVVTTVTGVALGVLALVAAVTFGRSLSHLLDTPPLYGLRWDVTLPDFEQGFDADALDVITRHPDVRGLAAGEAEVPLEVASHRVDALAFRTVSGDVGPPILEGRLPADGSEIALGRRSLDELGDSVGDTVDVQYADAGGPVAMRVVGEVVLPTLGPTTQLGKGAVVHTDAFRGLVPDFEGEGGAEANDGAPDDEAAAATVDDQERDAPTTAFIGVRAGADVEEVVSEINRDLRRDLSPQDTGKPNDIVNFARVEAMPLLLGGILAALAVATLAHTLVTAIQRRQSELAILKTLGFARSQVVACVICQATTLIAVALVIGVPGGVAGGRVAWSAFAANLGIVAEARVPLGSLLGLIPAGVLLANLIAVVPARTAARTQPALVLGTHSPR